MVQPETHLKKVSDFVDTVNHYGTSMAGTLSSEAYTSPVVKDQHVIAKSSTGHWRNAVVMSADPR
jgi:hypothetical protein